LVPEEKEVDKKKLKCGVKPTEAVLTHTDMSQAIAEMDR
jgi:hypothetical protein